MRVVMLEVPEDLLAERRRIGADRWDEMWDGVLHMVPPPSEPHQTLGSRLIAVLLPIAEAKGLIASYETGLYPPGTEQRDYRIPDIVVSAPERRTKLGVVGAADLVIEILSPGDETYEKLPFYESLGVREVLVVNPETRAVELFVLRGGKLHAALADDAGAVRSEVLGVTFARAERKLGLRWPGGSAAV